MSESATVTPLFPPGPSLADRLAARKAYRAVLRELAPGIVAQAFSIASRMPEAQPVAIDDAVRVFALAIRRELAEVAG